MPELPGLHIPSLWFWKGLVIMGARGFYQELVRQISEKRKAEVITFLSGPDQGKKYFAKDKAFTEEDLGTEVYRERVYGRPKAVILGGGHVSKELAKVLALLDFQVTVVDSRVEFANKDRFPGCQVCCREFDQWLEETPKDGFEYYIIITRGHKEDELCLRKILEKEYEYVGMIGSRGKVAKTLGKLEKDGFPREKLCQIHAPIGLPIKAQMPGEIAVSIGAEIIQVKNQVPRVVLEKELAQAVNDREFQVMATVIEKKGSSPRGAGTRMVIAPSGKIRGTIGGGAVEAAAIAYGKQMEADFAVQEYHLTNDAAAGLGMICGGGVKVMFEKL